MFKNLNFNCVDIGGIFVLRGMYSHLECRRFKPEIIQ